MSAPSKLFRIEVVTPERVVLATSAWFVAFPAFDGEMGILKDRAPLLAQLGTGVARIQSPEGNRRLFVDGGFAQMVDNRLTLLTEAAREPEAVAAGAAAKERGAAREVAGRDEASRQRRERHLARARAFGKLAS